MDEVDDAEELVARLPRGAVERAAGIEAVGGGAEVVGGEEGEALKREGKAGDAVGEGAVAVEVAAGGEVSGEGRGTLPHLAAAGSEAVVGGGEFLMACDPEAFGEEEEQEERSEALRTADVDAREGHAEVARSVSCEEAVASV